MILNGKLSVFDKTPVNYLLNTDNSLGYNCSKPLYVTNLLKILSINSYKPLPPIYNIWKGLDTSVWYTILGVFIILFIVYKITNKVYDNKFPDTLMGFIWIFFKPMLGILEQPIYVNHLYLLWLISLIPVVEIIKNELLANLLTRRLLYSHTIEDLMDDRLEVYTSNRNHREWTDPRFIDSLQNNSFKMSFKNLITSSNFKRWDTLEAFSHFVDTTKSPQIFHKSLQNVVIIQDQTWVDILIMFGTRFASIHTGQSYLPVLMTPLCYGPHFQFTNISQVM